MDRDKASYARPLQQSVEYKVNIILTLAEAATLAIDACTEPLL